MDHLSARHAVGELLWRTTESGNTLVEFSPTNSGLRFDFFCIPRRRGLMYGYEMKLTRADLLNCLREEKWRLYFPFCTHFNFVIHESVKFDYKEIPKEAGVKVFTVTPRGAANFTRIRGSQQRPMGLTQINQVLQGAFYRYENYLGIMRDKQNSGLPVRLGHLIEANPR